MYGNTIGMPGNSSANHTGLQKRVWRRGSDVNSCVVQLPVCAPHVRQRDWAATGHYSPKSLYLKLMKTTVAAASHRTKLYAQPSSSGSSRRPEEPFLPGKKPWPPTLPRHMVHVMWLLAPRRIQCSAWYSRKRSYPWTRAGARTYHPVREDSSKLTCFMVPLCRLVGLVVKKC